MNLATGTRLGPYELLSPLGAGGMGEVYKARDTRLDRAVAIKVLPAHLSNSSEFRQRFEREARAVSSLQHPHICTLHDIGRQDGVDYLVMEFLEGQTLADRIAKGPLPIDQVLRYAIQIADALDKAHRAGITHRDLKPGNIMITKAGAKLMDFGLAKLQGNGSATVSSLTSLPTERQSITAEGTILGTFQYMAPEQLEGREADTRTDIFAFGAVVYEMTTGKRAFTGRSQASLIGAILHIEPPPISTIQPMTPPSLDRVVRKCLAKDQDERWQSAHDLMSELKWIAEAGSQAGAPAAARRKIRERGWMIATVVFFLVAALLAVVYFRRAPVETAAAAMRFFIYPPEKVSFSPPFVSPDGRRVLLGGTSEGKNQLWVRALDSLSAQPLAGMEQASFPFWSPDSRFIGFFSSGKLKKIEATGGPAQTLCDAPQGRGGAWNGDSVIVFAPNFADALYRVSAAGGAPVPLTTLDASRKETAHSLPNFLPDGRHFIYLVTSVQRENSGIYIGSLDSKETKLLVNTNQGAAYAPPGYLLFMQERTLMAQSFDADRLELKGELFPVAEQVDLQVGAEPRLAFFSVSETGVLVYRSGSRRNYQLTWFDRSGNQLGTVGPPGPYANPWLSPDEKRVAVERGELPGQGGSSDIWLIDTGPRGATDRFTSDPARETNPLWSPDGSRIVFGSDRDGPYNLYQRQLSGAGGDEALVKSDDRKAPWDWSRDGRFILYAQQDDPKRRDDIWVLPLSEGQKPFPFLQTEFFESHAQFSPDGKWIAYSSDESGMWQVYVRSFPDRGGKWPVSTSGGVQPKWRSDQKQLFYISADKKLMVVDVKMDGANFEPSVPKALFDLRLRGGLPGPRNWYTVSKDGQRFLVSTDLEEATARPITVVLNWTADLKR